MRGREAEALVERASLQPLHHHEGARLLAGRDVLHTQSNHQPHHTSTRHYGEPGTTIISLKKDGGPAANPVKFPLWCLVVLGVWGPSGYLHDVGVVEGLHQLDLPPDLTHTQLVPLAVLPQDLSTRHTVMHRGKTAAH